MIDQTPASAPVVAPVIQVNADPARDQVEAGARQILLAVAAIAAALGYTHVAGQAGAFLEAAGAVAGLAAFVVGQLKTRALSKKAAAMAKALPDSVAVAK